MRLNKENVYVGNITKPINDIPVTLEKNAVLYKFDRRYLNVQALDSLRGRIFFRLRMFEFLKKDIVRDEKVGIGKKYAENLEDYFTAYGFGETVSHKQLLKNKKV